jgi:hypothetical protein
MKLLPRIAASIVAACLFFHAFGGEKAHAAATILPPPETCFAATTATSGGTTGSITLLGSITGGSGYASGGTNTYANVPLTGGSGAGALATITVTSGVVTNVTISNPGTHYATTDTLSASNGNLGGSGSGFSVPVVGVQGSGTGMIGVLGTITGGSGGTSGTYANVALTGGSGSNATANITVSGGAVTQAQIVNPGTAYQVGDVLSANGTSIGGVSGFSVPVNSISINSALAGGKVYTYIPNTLNFKTTWFNSDQAVSHQNANPVPLDANGCAIIIGTGTYRFIVQDSLGDTIYDQTTTDTSANNNYFWAGLAGGTPTAITVTDAGFNSTDGSIIGFTALSTNTGATTLLPSGYLGSPIPVEKDTTNGPVSLVGNEIIQNNPIEVVYRAADSAFHILNNVIQSSSGSAAPLCGAVGFAMGNASGSPNTEISLTANTALMVSATGNVINRSNVALTINFGVNGANGLDVNSIAASTPYYIWLIDNGAAPAGLASASSTSPTLPSGYTYSCRVGSTATDGSSRLLTFETLGSRTTTSSIELTQSSTGTCFTSFTAFSEPGIIPATAIFAVGGIQVVGATEAGINILTAAASSVAVSYTGVANLQEFLPYIVPLLPSAPSTLYYCSNSSSNGLYLNGWIDNVNSH